MLEQLRRIVGEKGMVVDPHGMEPWITDWRERRRGKALCVVLPASTSEVAAVVALCAAQGQPVFPIGGNTGLCYGAVPESRKPDKPGIMLSLRRMNRIGAIDRVTGVATVEAGVVLADLHQAAAAAERQFPLQLGSEGSAQIGGLISTNAGGTGVVRYGPMRDLVAGLEIVLPDGRVLSDLAALRKDNTGYMLRHLFIGAEGTLGIITGAALRLHPQTRNTAHAWLSVASPDAALSLLSALQERAGSCIQAIELMSAAQLELVRRHARHARFPFAHIPAWSVLVELGSEHPGMALDDILVDVLGILMEAGEVTDAVVAASEQQAAAFWHIRHSISEANKSEGVGIVHDVAVRPSDVPAFIAQADECAARHFPESRSQVVCHLGDGNVHYILMFQRSFWSALNDQEAYALEIERAIHDVAVGLGGTFSAEHGIGRKLTTELSRLADPLRYELMAGVKRLFDPNELMNPGALLTQSA